MTGAMEITRLVTIPASPQAPALARRAVAEALGPRHPQLDVALLATSEIVSNAVRHGDLESGDPIHLEIDRPSGRTRVTVSHPGAAVTSTRRAEPGPGGWGLKVVDAVAKDWDIGLHRGNVRAWFEIQSST
jgi:anti-sigma regulatory factor (Ser/Thr protein kinase)